MGRKADVRELLGRRVRAIRKHRELTQEELGERAGISTKFISEDERGEGNPSLDVLHRLSAALNVSVAQLTDFEEKRPAGLPIEAAAGLLAREQLNQYLADRTAADVERALRIVRAALDEEPPQR